jgi:hypothetical protein
VIWIRPAYGLTLALVGPFIAPSLLFSEEMSIDRFFIDIWFYTWRAACFLLPLTLPHLLQKRLSAGRPLELGLDVKWALAGVILGSAFFLLCFAIYPDWQDPDWQWNLSTWALTLSLSFFFSGACTLAGLATRFSISALQKVRS